MNEINKLQKKYNLRKNYDIWLIDKYRLFKANKNMIFYKEINLFYFRLDVNSKVQQHITNFDVHS